MNMLRGIIGLIGVLISCVGLISVWGTWMSNESTSQPWMMVIVGAVMFAQGLPPLLANHRKTIKELVREMNKR